MQIIADMHTHTVASTHAYSTIKENAFSASQAGLTAIAMTDHTPSEYDGPHIWHFHNLRKAIPREIFGVKIFYGAETNIISKNGDIDFPHEECSCLDFVIASHHMHIDGVNTPDDFTKMYLGTALNPDVDVIGHPANPGKEFDFERVLKAFKEHNKLVELNESTLNWKSTHKNYVEIISICKKHEIPIIVDSDSHYCDLIGKFPLSLQLLDELSFPENLVINADFHKLCEHINRKNQKIIF